MARRTKLWSVVEQIILDHYDDFGVGGDDPSNKVRLRGSFYIVREYLKQELDAGEITPNEYDHYAVDPQGYRTYRDDLWPSIEQEHGLDRPEAKPVGVIYTMGGEKPIKDFDQVYYRVRGFIFVEKADEAEMLLPLSNHGWAIVAGQGFSTRMMRHLFKHDGRPVLALHDCDTAGQDIYRVFGEGSRRTSHLDLVLARVADLGLTEDDALKLELESQPEAPKYRNKRKERVELSALNAFKVRYGIENPVLAYTISKMKLMGIRITPLPEEIPQLMQWQVESCIEAAFKDLASRINELADFPLLLAGEISNVLEYPGGEAVSVELPDIDNINFDISEPLSEPIEKLKSILQTELERIKPGLISELESAIDEADIVDEDSYERAMIRAYGDERISRMLEV